MLRRDIDRDRSSRREGRTIDDTVARHRSCDFDRGSTPPHVPGPVGTEGDDRGHADDADRRGIHGSLSVDHAGDATREWTTATEDLIVEPV